MFSLNKKWWVLAAIIASFAALVYALPPYSLQAYAYWAMKRGDFAEADVAFAVSGLQKWQTDDLGVAPIFVSANGGRVYFIGSVVRFGRQYDVSFTADDPEKHTCIPLFFYANHPLICDLPLGDKWSLHYESYL